MMRMGVGMAQHSVLVITWVRTEFFVLHTARASSDASAGGAARVARPLARRLALRRRRAAARAHDCSIVINSWYCRKPSLSLSK